MTRPGIVLVVARMLVPEGNGFEPAQAGAAGGWSVPSVDAAGARDAGGSSVARASGEGEGETPAQAGNGLGLTNMSERVRLAGGVFRLLTRLGHGTLVEAVLPVEVAKTKVV
jgi:hypothetical protein